MGGQWSYWAIGSQKESVAELVGPVGAILGSPLNGGHRELLQVFKQGSDTKSELCVMTVDLKTE